MPCPTRTPGLKRIGPGSRVLGADDGIRSRGPTLASPWRMSHTSPPVSAVPLTCTFLALMSHPSHQMAGVDSISLVISLVAGPQESAAMPGSDEAWQSCRWDQISGAAAKIAGAEGRQRYGAGLNPRDVSPRGPSRSATPSPRSALPTERRERQCAPRVAGSVESWSNPGGPAPS
jgi:hypothetical protein